MSEKMTKAAVAAMTTKQIAAAVAAVRGKSYKPASKTEALRAYEKAVGFAPSEIRHPIFDAKVFRLTYDRARQHPELMKFERQARTIVERWAASRKSRMTGAELRAFLEIDREEHFPGSSQREIVRIFQDYRRRLVDAGLVAVDKSGD